MAIVKWNPSRELLEVEREFDRIFNSLEKRFGFGHKTSDREEGYENAVWMPLTDISEDNDNFYLRLDMPGVNKNDVKISYCEGQMTISGERKAERESKNLQYHRSERAFGKFYRSFTLPSKIQENRIEAEFRDGTLMITIPKAEESKPKEIEVKVR
ncbi:MAG: Hsp20/alpha crystallin family protein [Bacillota bacterium]